MCRYPLYVPASRRRRLGAILINLFLLGLLGIAFESPDLAAMKELVDPLSFVLLLLFCVIPESPGKRVFNLTILDDEKRPVGPMTRLLRNLPYLLVYGILSMETIFRVSGHGGKIVIALLLMLALVFLSADALAVLLTPDGRSLLDMRLRTRVFTPSPLLGISAPKLFGIRIW